MTTPNSNPCTASKRVFSIYNLGQSLDRLYPHELFNLVQGGYIGDKLRAKIEDHIFFGKPLPLVSEVPLLDDPSPETKGELGNIKSEMEDLAREKSQLVERIHEIEEELTLLTLRESEIVRLFP